MGNRLVMSRVSRWLALVAIRATGYSYATPLRPVTILPSISQPAASGLPSRRFG